MTAPLDELRHAFKGRLYETATDMVPFLTDWRGRWTGTAVAVAQPRSVEDVVTVVNWCRRHRMAIVPQGGNTGLSGGATPEAGGQSLVLSLTRLNRVRQVDPLNNTIEVEAGVTLEQVQSVAKDVARLFPLSLAAQGTCTIGGNLATNAGGVQVLQFGNARSLCLGLEVVTPNGEVWNGLRSLRKDNTGYDLRDLYIGSEGTLGIITAAVLKLYPLPTSQISAFVAIADPQAAVGLLQLAQARLGPALTAFELLSDICLGLVEKYQAARSPLQERAPWYVLLEISDSGDDAHARPRIEDLLASALDAGLLKDAALSHSMAQFRALWALREGISEAQSSEGATIKHDIALPISRMPSFLQTVTAEISARHPDVLLVVFGHLGDGNLHFNVSPATSCTDRGGPVDFLAQEPALNRLVHDAVVDQGGSISAEHSLGVLRRDEAVRYKSPIEIKLMRAVKAALDPLYLMNPRKVLP